MEQAELISNESLLKLLSAIQVLKGTTGYSAARVELHRVTEPLIQELPTTRFAALLAFRLFDLRAGAMLPLVSTAQSCDAYITVLSDMYFTDAHTFLVGGPPESHARRFGGLYVNDLLGEPARLVHKLEARLRFWVTEGIKRGGDGSPIIAGDSQRPNVYAKEPAIAGEENTLPESKAKNGPNPPMESHGSTFGNPKSNADAAGPENLDTPLADTKKDVAGRQRRKDKGKESLLTGKQLVTIATAAQFLGIGRRQCQKLIKAKVLTAIGRGANRKVTTESIRKYLPQETAN